MKCRNWVLITWLLVQKQEEYEEKKAKERAYKQQQKIEELKSNETEIENIDVADFTYEDE